MSCLDSQLMAHVPGVSRDSILLASTGLFSLVYSLLPLFIGLWALKGTEKMVISLSPTGTNFVLVLAFAEKGSFVNKTMCLGST